MVAKVTTHTSQFLIGKVELYQENFPQRAEKEKFKSQFLIGKVEQINGIKKHKLITTLCLNSL